MRTPGRGWATRYEGGRTAHPTLLTNMAVTIHAAPRPEEGEMLVVWLLE